MHNTVVVCTQHIQKSLNLPTYTRSGISKYALQSVNCCRTNIWLVQLITICIPVLFERNWLLQAIVHLWKSIICEISTRWLLSYAIYNQINFSNKPLDLNIVFLWTMSTRNNFTLEKLQCGNTSTRENTFSIRTIHFFCTSQYLPCRLPIDLACASVERKR